MKRRAAIMLSMILFAGLAARAATNSWTSTAGNWTEGAKWSLTHAPLDGEDVMITNASASVVVSNATLALSSLTLSKTLTFTNWDSILSATNITIQTGGSMKLPGAFTNVAAANNIRLWCSNLTVQSSAFIDADGGGYQGGKTASHTSGYGPGGGGASGGGGHGGRGGGTNGGATNDDFTAPVLPGSGGGLEQSTDPYTGGAGGGAIRIWAGGRVDVKGVIRANGLKPSTGWTGTSGGAGGSIWLTGNTIAASNGLVQANGGDGTSTSALAGGGAGGCIAISYDTTAQSLIAKPDLLLSTKYGLGLNNGEIGTLCVPDGQLLPESGTNFNYRLYGLTDWVPATLAITNAWLGIGEVSCRLAVTNAVIVSGSSARFDLVSTNAFCGSLTVDNGTLMLKGINDAPSLRSNGDFLMTNSAKLYVYPCRTNDLTPAYGALITVSNTMTVGGSAIVYPYANTNGGATALFRVGNLTVEAGGQFNADTKGYPGFKQTALGMGLGRGKGWSGGGGYGGTGGNGSVGAYGGDAYGSSNAPVDCGSSGASENYSGGYGGTGGGAIRVDASNGTINILGTLSANGGGPTAGGDGGGSGGTVYLACQTLLGNGTIRANGGAGGAGVGGGGGGGGRVALISTADGFTGTATANGGSGGSTGQYSGKTGTLVRTGSAGSYNLYVRGNPTNHGTAAPYNYTPGSPHGVFIGSPVTDTVNSPADETNGTRYLCLGWTLTNQVGLVTNGTTPTASFTMTTNLFLTYNWTSSYYVAVTSGINGQLQADVSGWYTNGVMVTVAAVSNAGYHFLQWSGAGVPDGAGLTNPLTLTMDRPRTLQANFASDTSTTRTWSGTGVWLDPARWSPSGVPGESDTVVLASGTCVVADPTRIGDVSVRTNATLGFSNWTARLAAGDVRVNSNGIITVVSSFTQAQMSNRVYLTCRNLTLDRGGSIYVKELGYARPYQRVGWGPGRGYFKGGGGHGGVGANNPALYGQTYGDSNAPAFPGSSGGCETDIGDPYWGGGGGGAVWIEAVDRVTLDGIINADGGPGGGWSGDAGGSGGSIYISCRRFGGTGGALWARGGLGLTGANGGGGGGGRIAVVRAGDSSSGLQVSVDGGLGGAGQGGAGTLVWSWGSWRGAVYSVR